MICHECGTKIPVGQGKMGFCLGDFEISQVVLHKTCHLTKHCTARLEPAFAQEFGRKCCCGVIRWQAHNVDAGTYIYALDYQYQRKGFGPPHFHIFQYYLDYGTRFTHAVNQTGAPLDKSDWVLVQHDFRQEEDRKIAAKRERHEAIREALFTGLVPVCNHEPGVDCPVHPMTMENQVPADEFEVPIIELSRRDAMELAEAFINPPEPSAEAIAAAKRYKETIGEKGGEGIKAREVIELEGPVNVKATLEVHYGPETEVK